MTVDTKSQQRVSNGNSAAGTTVPTYVPDPPTSPPSSASSSSESLATAPVPPATNSGLNNGTSNGNSSNGNSGNGNGNGINTEFATDYHGFEQEEVTKLLIQSLYELGYQSVAQQLQDDSGLMIESGLVRYLRQSIEGGKWDDAEGILDQLDLNPQVSPSKLKFLIRRQQYLEKLNDQDPKGALEFLQTFLTPLKCNKEELHYLSTLVMFSSDDIKQQFGFENGKLYSRQQLLKELEEHMAPKEVLPPHRLATLLEQAKQYQIKKCQYWLGDEEFSLYRDLNLDRTNFPCTTYKVLRAHTDEVWHVAFSHNGKLLASASKDTTVKIWNTSDWELIGSLQGHSKGTVYTSWSPDDTKLISCGDDHRAILWDMTDFSKIQEYEEHEAIVSSACWLNNEEFLTSSPDLKMILWNIDGTILHKWTSIRVMAMGLTHSNRLLIALDSERNVHFIDMNSKETLRTVQFHDSCTHVAISKDSKYALINVKPEEVHLWNLETLRIERKFVGQLQKQFIIRSCFGGKHENFVLSGSHDSQIYVWNRDTGMLLDTLAGHSASVSSVTWSPIDDRMFVSASDDKTIRVWRS